jgi:hypothetical protein
MLKLLLEKNVDLAIKNKKGQTPIDISNSKTIITLFWNYLKKDDELKENKAGSSPRKTLNKKCSDKIQTKTSQKYYIEYKPDTILASVIPFIKIRKQQEVQVQRRGQNYQILHE